VSKFLALSVYLSVKKDGWLKNVMNSRSDT